VFSKRPALSNITSGWDTNALSTRMGIGSNTRMGWYRCVPISSVL